MDDKALRDERLGWLLAHTKATRKAQRFYFKIPRPKHTVEEAESQQDRDTIIALIEQKEAAKVEMQRCERCLANHLAELDNWHSDERYNRLRELVQSMLENQLAWIYATPGSEEKIATLKAAREIEHRVDEYLAAIENPQRRLF